MKDPGYDQKFEAIMNKHHINTIGVAVIESGEIDWTGYYGQQAPGIPASANTLFDVGSITKLITTQTVLQLVKAGKINLDEPMSEHWIDPDLINDERHQKLTPRLVLTHSTGLPNWRFFSDDNTLKFIHQPGSQYSYSGEGFQYLAKFVENKFSWEAITTLFENIYFDDDLITKQNSCSMAAEWLSFQSAPSQRK